MGGQVVLLRGGVRSVIAAFGQKSEEAGAMGADCIRSFKDYPFIEGAAFLALQSIHHTPQQSPSSAGLERAIS